MDGNRPQEETRWLKVIDDERGTLQIQFFRGLPFLHSTFRRRIEAMRAARDYFPQIKAWLKSMGHYEVLVCIPEGDDLLYKFEKRFGFREYKRRNGHIIMLQRC
jgi:hypothetical protein